MRINPLPTRFTRLWMAAWLGLAFPTFSRAQDPYPTPTPPDPLAGVAVQVLDQQQVIVGAHTITYNRIAPPVFPSPTPTSVPRTTRTTGTADHATLTTRTRGIPASHALQTRSKSVTRATHAGDTDGGGKQYKLLSFSATVYDHQFTALRWSGGTQPGLTAYINLDFCYFTTVTSLETADTVYDLVFAWGNDTAASLTQAGQPSPDFSFVPTGHAGYQIVAGDPNANPDAVAALNTLCAYYDANSAQMIAAYNQQQANNAAHQQWLQEHPPVQPDTVINFWPVKSQVYQAAGR